MQVVKGLDQKFLCWVESIFCCSGRVGSAIFGLGLGLERCELTRPELTFDPQ